MDTRFETFYAIQKAISHINGGNYSKERCERMLRNLDVKTDRVLVVIVSLVNNSFFKPQNLYNWMWWRYITTGKNTFPDKTELITREISKRSKDFSSVKTSVDLEFLDKLCGEIGKTFEFLYELNTDGESHLLRLFLADKIGIGTLYKYLEPNEKNKNHNEIYKRIKQLKIKIQKQSKQTPK